MSMEFHQRMGHISPVVAKRLVSQGFVTGMSLNTSSADGPIFCESCTYTKSHQDPIPKVCAGKRATKFGGGESTLMYGAQPLLKLLEAVIISSPLQMTTHDLCIFISYSTNLTLSRPTGLLKHGQTPCLTVGSKFFIPIAVASICLVPLSGTSLSRELFINSPFMTLPRKMG